MSQAAVSQLYGLAFFVIILGFAMVRRMRPQPVRPQRVMVSGVIIALVLGASLVGSGGRIISDPVALVLIPVFVVVGVGLGWYLVRTMTFWTDSATGTLWMKGGVLFALILLGTIAIRFGIRGLAYGSLFGPGSFGGGGGFTQPNAPRGLLYDLSADLLFLSLGLWVARAYFLVQRSRAHASGVGASAQS